MGRKARTVGQHLDVVVLGGALGGVVAAAVLAKAGRRVLLTGVADAPSMDGPVWQGAPFVRRVHEWVGLSLVGHPIGDASLGRQLLCPTRRVDLPLGRGALAALAAQWPEHAPHIEAFGERLRRQAQALALTARQCPFLLPRDSWDRFRQAASPSARRLLAPFGAADAQTLFGPWSPPPPLRRMLLLPLQTPPAAGTRLLAIRRLSAFWLEEALGVHAAQAFAALRERAERLGASVWPEPVAHVRPQGRGGWLVQSGQKAQAQARLVLVNPTAEQQQTHLWARAAASWAQPLTGGVNAYVLRGKRAWLPQPLAAQSHLLPSGDGPIYTLRRWPAAASSEGIEHLVVIPQAVDALRGWPQAWPLTQLDARGPDQTPPLGEAAQAAQVLPAELHRRLWALAPVFVERATARRWPGAVAPPSEAGLKRTAAVGPLATREGLQTHDGVLSAYGAEGSYWVGWQAAQASLRRLGGPALRPLSRPSAPAEAAPW